MGDIEEMKNNFCLKQHYNFLFTKMLLAFANSVFRESVGEYAFWVWWLAVLESYEHDETSASKTYARLEHLRSSRPQASVASEDDERKRSA